MPFFHIYLFIFYYKNYEKIKEVPVAKPRNNYYVVLSGRQPGIYKNWAECQRQVVGFKGARFKGFVTLGEAQSYRAAKVPRPLMLIV